MREDGYYWVRWKGDDRIIYTGWQIGLFSNHFGTWNLCGTEEDLYADDEFAEIDERRLAPPSHTTE